MRQLGGVKLEISRSHNAKILPVLAAISIATYLSIEDFQAVNQLLSSSTRLTEFTSENFMSLGLVTVVAGLLLLSLSIVFQKLRIPSLNLLQVLSSLSIGVAVIGTLIAISSSIVSLIGILLWEGHLKSILNKKGRIYFFSPILPLIVLIIGAKKNSKPWEVQIANKLAPKQRRRASELLAQVEGAVMVKLLRYYLPTSVKLRQRPSGSPTRRSQFIWAEADISGLCNWFTSQRAHTQRVHFF